MTLSGLIAKSALAGIDNAAVRSLEEICNRADGINLKFNWDMMGSRDPQQTSDFCYYSDGRLVGYVPLDAFGDKCEITGAVLPAYRHRGIFRALYTAARQEARNCNMAQMLLVNYRASVAGTATVTALGLAYESSEYHMVAYAAALPPLSVGHVTLAAVDDAHITDLSRMLGSTFAAERWNEPQELQAELQRANTRYFLAMLDTEPIGQIGVLTEPEGVYIRAVGVAPAWRRRGYGRQLLVATVLKMVAEGHTHFSLDVATDNSNALTLYQSCGFHETNIYDYYSVPLT